MFKRLTSFSPFIVLSTLLLSCQNSRCQEDVVCQTYVHRYGVPLEAEDWLARGKHGQVVSLRKDGVTVTQSYDAGVLDGECSYTFPHRDIIHKKECYVQGNLVEETVHYSSGMPQQSIVYHHPNQIVTTWYENGAPQSKEEFADGKVVTGEYYNLSNQIESRIEDGHGLRTCRNDQNVVEYVDTIHDGEMVQRTTYHPNGAPATAATYLNGQIEGERRTYLPAGEPATIETWTGDCQHGWTTEYIYGEKVAEVPYVKGQKHGVEQRFRDDGQFLVQEVTWVKGKQQGPCTSYVGNTKHVDWYFANRKVNKPTYDALMNQ